MTKEQAKLLRNLMWWSLLKEMEMITLEDNFNIFSLKEIFNK